MLSRILNEKKTDEVDRMSWRNSLRDLSYARPRLVDTFAGKELTRSSVKQCKVFLYLSVQEKYFYINVLKVAGMYK